MSLNYRDWSWQFYETLVIGVLLGIAILGNDYHILNFYGTGIVAGLALCIMLITAGAKKIGLL